MIKKSKVNKKARHSLIPQLRKEIGKRRKVISGLQTSKKELQKKDRLLKKKLMQKSDERIVKLRKKLTKSIYDSEKQLIREEHKYSNLIMQKFMSQKVASGLSTSESKDLENLSISYLAFGRFLKTGLKREIDKFGETCPWNTCWGCTAACGGCTSCGAACSPGCAGGSRPA